MIGTVVGYLAKSLKDNKALQDFFKEFSTETINWIKPLFIKEDNSPKEVVKKLQEKPDSTARQDAVKSAIAIELEDNPETKSKLQELYNAIQSKGEGGSTYNIDNRDAKIGQQNINSKVDNKDVDFTNQ